MLSKLDDLSHHLQKYLESISIMELVENESLFHFVEEVSDLIEKHSNSNSIKGN